MKIFRSLNPFSKDCHSIKEFKALSRRQKSIAVASACFGTLCPVLGTTFAFRAVVGHYKKINQKEHFEISIRRMYKNTLKAIEEHALSGGIYLNPSLLPPLEDFCGRRNRPCSFQVMQYEEQGLRVYMEDVSFFLEIPQGLIAGVLDGHGGSDVARFIQQGLLILLGQKISKYPSQIDLAFEEAAQQLQREIVNNNQFDEQGCTATVVFLEKTTGLVYTMNLGDSEANIYRHKQDQWYSIPLSAVRNWASPKDARRASRIFPDLKNYWDENQIPPKQRKWPNEFGRALNVSRAFGDNSFKPAVTSKPKITIQRVKRGDFLVIASDGIKDYLSEMQIVEALQEDDENKAFLIVKKALENNSRDNVSALVIAIEQV